jgi:lysophospholipase L1-like esterase
MPRNPCWQPRRLFALLGASLLAPTAPAADAGQWVSTWQASPQRVWDDDFVLPSQVPASIDDQTVRQVLRTSLGGKAVRLVFSNAYGTTPVTIAHVTVGHAVPGQPAAVSQLHPVTFGGDATARILPGASLVSDPVAMPVPALARLVVSVYVPTAIQVRTFHWDARQTSWLSPGHRSADPDLRVTDRREMRTRLLLSGVQVETGKPAATVVVLGDSITDGATATMDADHRWPDALAERMAPHHVAVINAGISGARLLSSGMGDNALARMDRDVLAQPGVRALIVLLGINDIAWPGTAFAREERRPSFHELVAGYRQLVAQAHARGIRVIGATLTPFEGALPDTPLSDYYHRDKDALRQQVNAWIREGGVFDAVVDMDAALRDPSHPARLAPRYDSGDHLHPGDEGNRAMADAVPLDVLLRVARARPDAAAQP